MGKYLDLYDVCVDHPEAENERQELCNQISSLRSALAEKTAQVERLKTVLTEVRECAEYWSEYDVPVGIVDRMDEALAATAPATPEASK